MALNDVYVDFAGSGTDSGTLANPWLSPSSMNSGVSAGDRVNIKFASRYTLTSTQVFTFAGTTGSPIVIRPYTSTAGDGGDMLLNMPASQAYYWSFTGANVIIDGLVDITHAGLTYQRPLDFQSNGGFIKSIKIVSTTTGTCTDALIRLDDCAFGDMYIESDGNSSSNEMAFINRANGSSVVCVATNGREGMFLQYGYRSNTIARALVYSKASTTAGGVTVAAANSTGGYIGQLTIHGYDNALVFDTFPVALSEALIVDGLIISGASVGITNSDSTYKHGVIFNNVAIYNTTTDTSGLSDNYIINQISLTSDPFTNSANYDFRLNTAAGGGALCRGQTPFAAGEVANQLDIGAIQGNRGARASMSVGV